jgi:hypothetical protein
MVASCKVASCKVTSCKVASCKVASCTGILHPLEATSLDLKHADLVKSPCFTHNL